MNLEQKFLKIIEKKHRELNLGKDYSKIFSKIKDFEANAIGQIGEEFLKSIIAELTEIIDDGIIHNEYDIQTKTGKYIEIKTARKGRKNNTFQFNGINPRYNYDLMICFGICEDKLLYRIFKKTDLKYIHKDRKYLIEQDGFKKQLVQMNPDNHVNFKLTMSIIDLFDISNFIEELNKSL